MVCLNFTKKYLWGKCNPESHTDGVVGIVFKVLFGLVDRPI